MAAVERCYFANSGHYEVLRLALAIVDLEKKMRRKTEKKIGFIIRWVKETGFWPSIIQSIRQFSMINNVGAYKEKNDEIIIVFASIEI